MSDPPLNATIRGDPPLTKADSDLYLLSLPSRTPSFQRSRSNTTRNEDALLLGLTWRTSQTPAFQRPRTQTIRNEEALLLAPPLSKTDVSFLRQTSFLHLPSSDMMSSTMRLRRNTMKKMDETLRLEESLDVELLEIVEEPEETWPEGSPQALHRASAKSYLRAKKELTERYIQRLLVSKEATVEDLHSLRKKVLDNEYGGCTLEGFTKIFRIRDKKNAEILLEAFGLTPGKLLDFEDIVHVYYQLSRHGSEGIKALALFRLLDVSRSGEVPTATLTEIIKTCFTKSGMVTLTPAQASSVAEACIASLQNTTLSPLVPTRTDGDTCRTSISENEFVDAVRWLDFSLPASIPPITPHEPITYKRRIVRFFTRSRYRRVWEMGWLVGTCVYGLTEYIRYLDTECLFRIFGHGLCISRSCAGMLNLQVPMVVLLMCRRLIGYGHYLSGAGRWIPLHLHKEYHIYVAMAITVLSLVHTGAHTYNFVRLANTAHNVTTACVGNSVPVIHHWYEALGTIVGATGLGLLIVLLLIGASSHSYARNGHFNVFFSMHKVLLWVFCILLLVHGSQSVYGTYMSKFLLSPALLIFIVNQIVSHSGSRKLRPIVSIKEHKGEVLGIKVALPKSTMLRQYVPGQYVNVCCDRLSKFEWHSFTLTNAAASTGEFLEFHVQARGDWTRALHKVLIGQSSENWPPLRIDGPYGSVSSGYKHYKTLILVASGIGVTPCASILRTLMLQQDSTNGDGLEMLYFVWVARSFENLTWFSELLNTFLEEFKLPMEVMVFVTRPPPMATQWDLSLAREMIYASTGLDAYTGIRVKALSGRPDFHGIFSGVKFAHYGESIGVFFCGNPELGDTIESVCDELSRTGPDDRTEFCFTQEIF